VWIGFCLLAVAAYSVGLAIWTWRRRHTPLSVDPDGRVSYGRRELAAPGSVRGVRLREARGGDAGECEISLELAGGRAVLLPNPYFARYSTRGQARPLAAKLAEALGVSVMDST
jgi:hypothetical protein